MNPLDIREHMEVVDSAGNHVGVVDGVEGASIKLRRSGTDGRHHYVAVEWVHSIGQTVRLNRSRAEVVQDWQAEPVWAGGG